MNVHSTTVKKVISWGFYLLAITPLLIGMTMYFPFITLKTFYARTIIEIIFALSAYVYLTTREVRITRTWLFYAFSAWILVLILASLFGKDPYISFFSDYERSWGVLTQFHFYLLFLVASSVIEEAQWTRFFNFSIIAAVAVSVYGFGQRLGASWVTQPGIDRISSTLGNPTYVAIYLVFNVFFAVLLLTRSYNLKWKIYYALTIAVNLLAFTFTAIRGASLGLFTACVVSLILYVFLSKSKKAKQVSFAILIILIGTTGFLYANRNTKWIAGIPYVNRVINISLNGATAQTRFVGWRAGLLGFRDYPLLGVGPENYGVVFNKYFEAKFYNIAPTETFFDRAHNVTIDVLATTGSLGFLTYVGLYIALVSAIVGAYRKGTINKHLMIGGVAMTITYFIHSQFVFDDLISLLMFTVFASYYARFVGRSGPRERPLITPQGGITAGAIIIAVGLLSIWVVNYRAYQANVATGHLSSVDSIDETIATFKLAESYGTFQEQDIRLAYADKIVQYASRGEDPKKLQGGLDLAITQLEEEMKHSKEDVYIGIKLLSLYNLRGIITNDVSYLHKADTFGEYMLTLSPQRLQLYYLTSETQVFLGNPDKAIEYLNKALSYNSEYKDTYWFLGRAYLEAGKTDEGYTALNTALERGFRNVAPGPIISAMNKFVARKDFVSVERIYELVAPYANDAQLYAILAAVEQQLKHNDKAIDYALKAASLDPTHYDAEARTFIDQIKASTR